MVAPDGNISIGAISRVGRYRFRSGAECGERGHAVGIIVAEAYRLNPCTLFRELAATDIIAVAEGVALCVRYRGGRVVATVRSVLNHPVGRVAASGGSRYPGIIRLRERKAIHRHGFCGDVAGGQGVV